MILLVNPEICSILPNNLMVWNQIKYIKLLACSQEVITVMWACHSWQCMHEKTEGWLVKGHYCRAFWLYLNPYHGTWRFVDALPCVFVQIDETSFWFPKTCCSWWTIILIPRRRPFSQSPPVNKSTPWYSHGLLVEWVNKMKVSLWDFVQWWQCQKVHLVIW